MKFEITYMLENGEGVILNTSSLKDLVGIPAISSHTASKHVIVGLTISVAGFMVGQVVAVDGGYAAV